MSLEQDIQDFADCLVDLENSGYTDCYRKTEGIEIVGNESSEDIARDLTEIYWENIDYREEN